MPPKVWGYPLKPGDRVSIETPGAGGYGPPEERALEQRQEDERDGISRGRTVSFPPRGGCAPPSRARGGRGA